jgi:Xaa-Pro aminopeptidase
MHLGKQKGFAVFTFALLAGIAGTAVPASAWDRGNLADYHERRERLVAATGDGVIVLYGYKDADVAASVTTFHQNEEFYYLTGWNQPDAIMMLVPKARQEAQGEAEIGQEIIFIPTHDYREEKWTGPKLGPDDPNARQETGFATVMPTTKFDSELHAALKHFPKIYTEMTPQPESGEDCFEAGMLENLKKLAPQATFADLRLQIQKLRVIKSPGEIALIRKAVDASIEAHLAAMKAVHPGVWEYEIAALMKYEFERRGCEWPSYPPIVGSGFYSTVLHYDADSHQMHDGDVVVMDVAGSYSGYASDITRTLPVNGHFTARQREIYEIVLGAQRAAISAARPGIYIRGAGKESLYKIAYDYIDSHGTDLHGKKLGQYFIHGLSHSVGLNVHDPQDYNAPLAAGMVVTIEPGIYIPEENLGVRIEDDILITPHGAEVLTQRLPRTVEEIERIMAGK